MYLHTTHIEKVGIALMNKLTLQKTEHNKIRANG
jgi:hypothetical protein